MQSAVDCKNVLKAHSTYESLLSITMVVPEWWYLEMVYAPTIIHVRDVG